MRKDPLSEYEFSSKVFEITAIFSISKGKMEIAPNKVSMKITPDKYGDVSHYSLRKQVMMGGLDILGFSNFRDYHNSEKGKFDGQIKVEIFCKRLSDGYDFHNEVLSTIFIEGAKIVSEENVFDMFDFLTD